MCHSEQCDEVSCYPVGDRAVPLCGLPACVGSPPVSLWGAFLLIRSVLRERERERICCNFITVCCRNSFILLLLIVAKLLLRPHCECNLSTGVCVRGLVPSPCPDGPPALWTGSRGLDRTWRQGGEVGTSLQVLTDSFQADLLQTLSPGSLKKRIISGQLRFSPFSTTYAH